MTIDRCVCFDQTFAHLRRVAERTGAATVEALAREAVFGRKCGLCRPYVQRMLETGETVFHAVIPDDAPGP